MSLDYKKRFGILGENIAVKYIKDNGYKILDRNFRTEYGEIDIIAEKNKIIVFIEVKTMSSYLDNPFEKITKKKITNYSKVILQYLSEKKLIDSSYRIDYIYIVKNSNIFKIEHIKNITGF